MSFSELNLHSNINKAIEVCGYTTPTSIQSRSIPEIIKGSDVVGCAQTGTGKTAAFILPALNLLAESKKTTKPRILILTPTRELARQITDAVTRYGKYLQINMISLLGGMPYDKQIKALSRPLDIIVSTPGRLMDHMERRRVDLSEIEMFILDEADRMLDMGFIDDVKFIASKIPETRQTLLFSATIDNRISRIINDLLKNPVKIDIKKETKTPTDIQQKLFYADNAKHKVQLLKHMIDNENIFKAIIFTGTKLYADQLCDELNDLGYAAAPLHGDLKQAMRNRTIEQLRKGKIQFLVATDVAARGIDISDITHVINFDLPKFEEDYVHRIGRTGRAGKSGIAISLATPIDIRHLKKIERFINQTIPVSEIAGLEPKPGSKNASPDKKRRHGKKSDQKPFSRHKKSGEKSARSGKPASFDRSDRPARSSDRSERPARSFDRSDRPARSSDRSERPARSFDRSDRPARRSSDRSDRPARSSDRSDRPARSFDRSDRPARSSDRSDRPARSFDRSDRPARSSDRSERPARSFDRSDRPARSSDRSDRPARSSDRSDRPARSSDRSDRPARSSDRSERPARSFDRSDKPARSSAKSARPAKFSKSTKRD